VTENRILRNQITGRMRLTDGERKTLADIGSKLGKQALAEVATIVKPDTILAWHRKLVAHKFDGSQQRRSPGRPKIGSCTRPLRIIPLASKPGKMPPSQPVLEGARPWCHIIFSINSPRSISRNL
jgi:hypothetical protein